MPQSGHVAFGAPAGCGDSGAEGAAQETGPYYPRNYNNNCQNFINSILNFHYFGT
jgi:hypothetical protein